ncbi:hypothetical protein V6N11_080002 [Hibiscus sabdariffa]|uniref:Uncharacterized protein n=1 Tax=Hibiscus sabdariffa TaxID=183260 RepID=A0ABR2RWZ7_9ROSI
MNKYSLKVEIVCRPEINKGQSIHATLDLSQKAEKGMLLKDELCSEDRRNRFLNCLFSSCPQSSHKEKKSRNG